MTKTLIIVLLISAMLAYGFIVLLFPFAGPVALTMHFSRLAATIGAFVVCTQAVPALFEEVPPPRRDYLTMGVNFFAASAIYFSFLNEAHRIWPQVDNDIFSGAEAGFGSLLLLIGALFVLIAPGKRLRRLKLIALSIGAVVSAGLVFVAPLFR